MSLSRADFLANKALPVEEVKVPGGSVFVATLTASQRDRYEVEQAEANREADAKGVDFRARLVVATARSEDGSALFTEEDLPALSGMSCAVLDPIVNVALRLNRFSDQDVKELQKN